MLVHIQHVTLDMKNENKTTVLILIFPGENALLNHRKSLKNGSLKHFVSLRKLNHICRPSFYTKNGLWKRDLQSFRIWMNQNTKYCTQKLYDFFGYYIHPHQKSLTKKKRVLFLDENFNFSLFSRVLRVKQYANLVPLKVLARYMKVHNKTRTPSYQKVKNIWKRDYIAFVH